MSEYRVRWGIDVEADTPEQAAREALRIQRDPESVATCFDVAPRIVEGSAMDSAFAPWQTIDLGPA